MVHHRICCLAGHPVELSEHIIDIEVDVLQVARSVRNILRASVQHPVVVDEEHVARFEAEGHPVGRIADDRAEQPVRLVPRAEVGVVERQRLHQLVGEPQVLHPAVTLAHQQGVAAEAFCIGGVLAMAHLHAAEHIRGAGLDCVELVDDRP